MGLAPDGAASNNRLDLFAEMRLAALLLQAAANDAAVLPAEAALARRRPSCAQALNLDSQIGSLTPGKRADMVAVDLNAAHHQPV